MQRKERTSNMTFFNILGSLLIGPLKLIFEIIYELAHRMVGHPGLAIIFLSLIMNILVLPLYRRADAMQEAARDVEAKLAPGVDRIKRAFKGDERMMILQTYYRQNNYKPTDALNGSVSLLLEVPFFMAAYQFLSKLEILKGVSLGPITDLGAPDGLIVIGGIAINLLPVLMTAINFISCSLYLKGFPLKTKIQLYGMALFFLVFLYTSPSGLVFYWTLNNLFSLVKTIFYKIKNPKKVLKVLTFVLGIAFMAFGGFIYNTDSIKRRVLLIGIGLLLIMPTILPLFENKNKKKEEKAPVKNNPALFFSGSVFLTVLVGLLIPTTYIAASPQEYVDITYFYDPIWYVVSALCFAAGTFIIWLGVFYWLASPKGKVIFDRIVWVLSGVTLVNYMFFGTKLGLITSSLQYENGMIFELKERLLNTAIILAIVVVMYLFAVKWHKAASMVLITAIIALGGMSVVNISKINTSISEISEQLASADDAPPQINLSKDGQNVVVIMLDRAMGEYVPYIMNEKPELMEQFDGFTYYQNTMSFGSFTNFGTPPIMGGYEYTPVEMNKRADEPLVEKHNEAILVMPRIFSENGFKTTVFDPIYANYKWAPDVSLFDDYPEITAVTTNGKFTNIATKEAVVENNMRNFFCFSAMKVMPILLQPTVYDDGQYLHIVVESENEEDIVYTTQERDGVSKSSGIFANFMESYETFQHLPYMTKVNEGTQGTYLFMTGNFTHEPMLLQTPDYVPAQNVDNTEYDAENADRFIVDGEQLKVEKESQMIHYHANMAAFLKIGEWLEHLKAEGIYDNTRIIIVSDHGRDLEQLDSMIVYDETGAKIDMEYYYPLLIVKDFNSKGFTVSDEFMTNADVPTLALEGLIENPVNPFTGNVITNDEKTAHEQYIIISSIYDVNTNNGNTFLPGKWVSIKDSIRDRENWTFFTEKTVLGEHAFP